MRIALFTESYSPVINGVATAVEWLAEALRERGHTVVVFAPRYPGHVDPSGHAVRFPSFILPHHPNYPLAYPTSRDVFRAFRDGEFQVAHSHTPFATGQAARRWARRLGVPLVTTYHTLYAEYAHYAGSVVQAVARRWLIHLSRRYCQSADAVVVPTAPIRDVLRSYGLKRSVEVIPTGLPSRPPPAPDPTFPRGEFGIPPGAPLVLYAGRLAREKNLGLLFSAFARVAKALPQARLLVAGGGPWLERARALARDTGAGERIVLPGFIPRHRLPLCYVAADVLAFSSMTDTQGLVLVEAKACGLSAVSVAAHGPATIVRDGVDGFLTPNDPQVFADCLLRLLCDRDLRARMSEAARADAARFSIHTTARRYEEIYARVQRKRSGW
ncbi:MAG: glycosyltransferase [Armatimonadetes bacterium]|nr:glycosyltransferase [Armatimonadota bacterium]